MANPKAYNNGIATQFKQRLDVELADKPIPVRFTLTSAAQSLAVA